MQIDPTPTVSNRSNLGQGLTADLQRLIGNGDLADGARINEVHLARDLGVSRTPLREALISLATEGLLTVRPRRGFFVSPLDADELADLYAMRTLLDPYALRLAGIPSMKRLDTLEALNAKLDRIGDARQAVDLDNKWHRALIAHCPNGILLHTIEQFIVLTQRYELAYFRETAHVATAFEEHKVILAALRAGNLDSAREALRQNMRSAVEPMQDWLENRRK